MKGFKKTFLVIIVFIICFMGSIFGTYKYNELKLFNNLANQGKQYMTEKDYDKAIQSFKKALVYKNDFDVQKNLILAQNLKNEDIKKGQISKNLQSANDAIKNSKYDDANKYLDEVLKLDSDNTDAKTLKDTVTKLIQQQEKIVVASNINNNQNKNSSNNISKSSGISYNEALQIVKKQKPSASFQLAQNIVDEATLNRIVTPSRLNSNYVFYETDSDGSDSEYLVLVSKTTGNISYVDSMSRIYKNLN